MIGVSATKGGNSCGKISSARSQRSGRGSPAADAQRPAAGPVSGRGAALRSGRARNAASPSLGITGTSDSSRVLASQTFPAYITMMWS